MCVFSPLTYVCFSIFLVVVVVAVTWLQADALSNRAAAHIMLDNASSALDDCEEALRIFPEHERAQVRRATTKMYMCQFEEARSLLIKCLERNMEGKGLNADVREKLSVVEAILKLIHVDAKAFPMSKTAALELVGKLGKHLEYLPKSRELIEAKCNVLLSLHEYSQVFSVLAKVTTKDLLPAKVLVSQYSKKTCEFDSGLQWLEALACSGLGQLEKAVRLGEMCCRYVLRCIYLSIYQAQPQFSSDICLKTPFLPSFLSFFPYVY